ncbi:DUF4880 domain-containing protein [Serratia marcescens]|nr:DUF4880 domain-containing protein [Serratia marcescens]
MMESDIDRQSAREAAAWLTQLMSEEASDADRENWRRWYQAKPENERAWRHIAAFSSRFSLLNGARRSVVCRSCQTRNAAGC